MTAAAVPPTSSAPALTSRFWADLTTRDFAALQSAGQADQVVAVLPVAAVEQHGPHLPLSVDATLLQGVIDAALPQLPAELPVLFLPPQNVGLSPEHIRFPGTLTLSPGTVIALWTEIGECVARELRTRCNLIVYSASWFSLPLPDAVAALPVDAGGDGRTVRDLRHAVFLSGGGDVHDVAGGVTVSVLALAGVGNGDLDAVGQHQHTAVTRLAAAQGVEHGLVQHDPGIGDGGDVGAAFAQVGVLAEEVLGHGGMLAALLAVSQRPTAPLPCTHDFCRIDSLALPLLGRLVHP